MSPVGSELSVAVGEQREVGSGQTLMERATASLLRTTAFVEASALNIRMRGRSSITIKEKSCLPTFQ